jgi:hypothetical protein
MLVAASAALRGERTLIDVERLFAEVF